MSIQTLSMGPLSAIVVFVSIPKPAVGVELAYGFTGNVYQVGDDDPFGIPISDFDSALVTGHFVYNTLTPNSHNEGEYLQRHINGFAATFGSHSVSASEYLILVADDLDLGGNFVLDFFSILFATNLDPPLTSKLKVNGTTAPADPDPISGDFNINLTANSSDLFSNSALPTSLSVTDFQLPEFANFFSDGSFPTPIDVSFQITALFPLELNPNDHDVDGDVDGADFLIQQRSFGSAQNGDANHDLVVDAIDVGLWESAFGVNDQLRAVSQITPEPGSAAIWLAGAIGPLFLRGRRRDRATMSGNNLHRFQLRQKF